MSQPPQDTPGPGADRAGQARRLLQIPSDAPADSLPGQLWDRLVEADFVPPAGWRQAIRLLAAPERYRPPADDDALLAAGQPQLQEEVDALAAAWFDLPAAERRARWTDLGAQCAPFPPLAARLRDLEKSLAIEFPAGPCGDRRMDALLAHFRAALVLRPAARDALDWEFLQQMHNEIREDGGAQQAATGPAVPWSEALRRFQEEFPAMAQLAPEFFRAAAGNPWDLYRSPDSSRQNQRAKAAEAPADAPTGINLKARAKGNYGQEAVDPRGPATSKAERRPASDAGSDGSSIWKWVVIVVAISLARLVCNHAARGPSTPIKPPSITAPGGPWHSDPKWLEEQRKRLLEEIRRAEAEGKAGPDGPKPGVPRR